MYRVYAASLYTVGITGKANPYSGNTQKWSLKLINYKASE